MATRTLVGWNLGARRRQGPEEIEIRSSNPRTYCAAARPTGQVSGERQRAGGGGWGRWSGGAGEAAELVEEEVPGEPVALDPAAGRPRG